MNLQITLLIISVLLIIMLVLLVWVIRLGLNKRIIIKPLEATSPIINQPQQIHKPKYANSKLSKAEKEHYLRKVIKAMEVDKIYRQSDLTIKHLASELVIPKYVLSQVINELLDSGFLDFVNRYRVEEAKEKLQDQTLEMVSILAIGKKVGFKAKSTFYAVFKKHTDQTPAAFRKAALKNVY